MTTFRRFFVFVIITLLCGLFAMGCDDIITDPNFHTWCGDQLCSWKLESGKIQRAPTWHPKDYGVELLDNTTDPSHTTAISQVVDKTPKCLVFTTVADVAPEAQVSIGVDFDNDGTLEVDEQISATGFTEQKTQVTAPAHYTGIRFVISKKGTGRAVLAQMDVRSTDNCTAAPKELKKQVIGTLCNDANHGAECLSGICCERLCGECCVGETVMVPQDDAGTRPPTACAAGGTCKRRFLSSRNPSDVFAAPSFPKQCDPGEHKRASGEDCMLGDDCASGMCNGAVVESSNVVNDAGACPPPPQQSAECIVSYARGGTCR